MNVDLKPLSLLTFKTFSVIHVARKDGYKGCFSDDDDRDKRENEELPTDTSSSRFGQTITVSYSGSSPIADFPPG